MRWRSVPRARRGGSVVAIDSESNVRFRLAPLLRVAFKSLLATTSQRQCVTLTSCRDRPVNRSRKASHQKLVNRLRVACRYCILARVARPCHGDRRFAFANEHVSCDLLVTQHRLDSSRANRMPLHVAPVPSRRLTPGSASARSPTHSLAWVFLRLLCSSPPRILGLLSNLTLFRHF